MSVMSWSPHFLAVGVCHWLPARPPPHLQDKIQAPWRLWGSPYSDPCLFLWVSNPFLPWTNGTSRGYLKRRPCVYLYLDPLPLLTKEIPQVLKYPPLSCLPQVVSSGETIFYILTPTLHCELLRGGHCGWVSHRQFPSAKQSAWLMAGISVNFNKWKKEWLTKSSIIISTTPTKKPLSEPFS